MLHASEQNRPDIKRQRDEWRELQQDLDAGKLVFLDESGINTDLTRLYGRAKGQERVHDHAPLNTPQKLTVLSSIRLDGTSVLTRFSGSLSGNIFLEYIRDGLCPTLKAGDIVVMDNLSCHKVSGVKEAIEAVGARVMYLPPYSPDFNPIEMLWSKLKAILRALKLRSSHLLEAAVPFLFDAVTLSDIVGWFTEAGYSIS